MMIMKKNIGIPQDWDEEVKRVVNMINIARFTILFSLLIFIAVMHNVRDTITAGSTYLPLVRREGWLQIWCAVYGVLILFSLANPAWQLQKIRRRPNLSALIDITMIAALTWLAGGVQSGFGILVLPFLATACVLSYGRYPLLYGSYAALLVGIDIFSKFYPFHKGAFGDNLPVLMGQVLLIAACYIVPVLTSYSSRYLAQAEETISEHKRAFERLTALNEIALSRIQEGVIVVDAECRVWQFNRQAKQYFSELKLNHTAHFANGLVQNWQLKPDYPFETLSLLNDTMMYVRAVPAMQEDNELLMLFLRSQRERRAEAQTEKLTALGMLTANFAHEIRNPLSAMRQASGLLQENAEESQDPVQLKLSGVIEKNIARIDKMIEDISMLNKRDRINTEDIRLPYFWFNFVQEFYLAHPDAKGCLKLDAPNGISFIAEFDAMHLQQILWNLCNNAWRHSSKGPDSITVSLRLFGRNNIALRVWDDGTGVPESVQTHLFEPFNTTQKDGTGLGLYVARELAHANKGDLTYVAHAKSFELILPRTKKDEQQP